MDRDDELKAIAEWDAKGKITRIDNPLAVAAHNEEQNARDHKVRADRARRAQRKSNVNRSRAKPA